jgi:hypothetical protein
MVLQVLLNSLRDQIELGLVQARRGELLDGDAVFEELKRRASELDRSR